VARQLATAGINTLAVDVRGYGETCGKSDKTKRAGDRDTAFEFLISQPGVDRSVIGIGGARALGVDNSVETARRHADRVKSLVLISGETLRPQLQFLHDNLAGAYLKDGQKALARLHAEKALAILNDHEIPASSWTDTEQYRGEILRDAEKILKQLAPGS
jgi:hypothetical protein